MALKRGIDTLYGTDASDDKEAKKSKTKKSSPKTSPKEKVITKEVVKEVIKEVPAEQFLPVSDIEPNRLQPRKNFDEDALAELSDSIKQYGVVEPIIVAKKGKGYEIIAGERRWRAARMAGLKTVPVIIRDYSDQERMEVALIENLQRKDLNAIEEALAFKALIDEYDLKQDEVADKVSKSRTTITNSLRLLKLSENVQQMLIDDMISSGHARALLAIEDPDVQYSTAMSVFDEGLSVRETENLVKGVLNVLSGKDIDKDGRVVSDTKKDEAMEAILAQVADDLKMTLGTKVNVKAKGKKGKIEIEYKNADDLERIIHIIKGAN